MKFVSWNVNGLRSVARGGFPNFLSEYQPDIVCLQEIKASPADVDEALFAGYHTYWNSAVKKGYSGVLLASRREPISVNLGLGLPEHDGEGRVVTAEFADFYVASVYVPNAKRGLVRLEYRLEWDAAFLGYLRTLDAKKPVIFCGDLNVAHQEIDIANPKGNRRNAGFTDEERANFTRLLEAGFVDTFRELHPDQPGHYSWWVWFANARARNLGWRIDYWIVSKRLWPRVKNAAILKDIMGSDHCPVTLEIE